MQEIPRSSDRAPSRTTYTFRATMQGARARMGCMLYKTAGNLLARLESEMLKSKDLLEKVSLLTKGELHNWQLDAAKVAQLKTVTQALEASLVRLDSQIALFCDYGA
jgi:hypothetical protein